MSANINNLPFIPLAELTVGQSFLDPQLVESDSSDNQVVLAIVEDHVYIAYQPENGRIVIISSDEGNGNGTVIQKLEFDSHEEMVSFLDKEPDDWNAYCKEQVFETYNGMIKF